MSPKKSRTSSGQATKLPVVAEVCELHPRGFGLAAGSETPPDKRRELAVWGALPGEQVQVQILGGGQQRAFGRTTRVLFASAQRVQPPCAHASTCGGCQLQHLSLEGQREWKHGHVLRALAQSPPRLGVAPVQVVGPAEGFRSKFMPMVGRGISGTLGLGLYEPHSHQLVALQSCLAQDGPSWQAAQMGWELVQKLEGVESWLRGLLCRSNGSVALSTLLCTANAPRTELQRLAETWVAGGKTIGVALNVSNPSGNALLGQHTEALAGEQRLTISLPLARFEIGPTSFVQTHLPGAQRLLELVLDFAGPAPGRVVDLYAGAGMFSVALAPRATQVAAVEAQTEAAAFAEHNLAPFPHARAYALTTEVFAQECGPYDFAVVDPPRAGCSATVLDALVGKMQVPRIVYVSCHLDSLARDAAELVARGYVLERVVPVDLFPHTTHVESVAYLVRKGL